MRVLEIVYTWPAETFIARHVQALLKHSNLMLQIGSRSPGRSQSASVQASQVPDISAVYLPNFDHLPGANKAKFWLHSLMKSPVSDWSRRPRDLVLLQTIRSLKPDLFHFHASSLAVAIAHYARELEIPYTFSLRGSDIQAMPLTTLGYADMLCEVAQHAMGIHAVVDSFASQLEHLCGRKLSITTIRTCVPIAETMPERDTSTSEVRLISVGRLHWRKGYPDLIRAFQYLPGEFRLDIVGDGPEREFLLYLIHALELGDRIVLHGSLPYDQFRSLLMRAAAYVQSSLAEGFSNAAAEAMEIEIGNEFIALSWQSAHETFSLGMSASNHSPWYVREFVNVGRILTYPIQHNSMCFS